MAGKPVTVEIDTLGFVPAAPRLRATATPTGRTASGRARAGPSRCVVDLTDPAVVPRIPFGIIDHVGHAFVRRRRGLGPVRARQHRRARADRLHRPDVRRAVTRRRRGPGSADGVELVELDDPGRYNALTTAMVAELRDTFADLRADRDGARGRSSTGRGKGFCAGANMTGDDVTPAGSAGPRSGRGRSTSSRTTSPSSCWRSTSCRSR